MFLFAAEAAGFSTAWLKTIFGSPYSIPIVLFIMGGIVALTSIITHTILSWRKQTMKHRERLAMIDRGMHPDAPEGQGDATRATAGQGAATYQPLR